MTFCEVLHVHKCPQVFNYFQSKSEIKASTIKNIVKPIYLLTIWNEIYEEILKRNLLPQSQIIDAVNDGYVVKRI